MIKLVPIDAVRASEYNPRRNDEKRLALTELSLRKLGFLLPIYADESGEILSGHQRHLVASRMGFQQIPVEYVSGKTLGERRAVNVLFNRATNDLQKQDTCAIIRRRLYEMDIEAMTGELPDIEPGSEASFPCVYDLRRMDIVKLAKLNHRSFDTHIKQLAKSLERRIGNAMPVVIGEAGNVINGIGRLQVAAEAGRKVIACVEVRPEQEAFASSMLNLLSMDFDMESTYADDLRFNSFMRERNTRETDAEGNAALGDIGAHPKVQKGHTEEEMRAIFAPCFRTVKRLEMITKFWYMEAADPIVDPAALAAALDFEFELPYPDGSRMGLSQRAREAFEHRLGIRLPPPTKGEAK